MNMHHIGKFVEGRVLTHQHRDLLDHVGSMGSERMTTQDFSLRRGEEFQHTLGLVHRQGFAVSTPEGLPTLVGNALFLQLIFRRSYTGSLRFCEYRCRHDVETDTIGLTQDMVYGTYGLHLCRMGQHLPTVGIADGVDIGDGLIVIIYRDSALWSEGDADGFEVQACGTWFTTCSHQDDISLEICNVLYGSLHLKGDASLLQ